MIELNNVTLMSSSFKRGFESLLNNHNTPIDYSLRIQVLARELEKKVKEARIGWVELADRLVKTDEKGNYAVVDGDFDFKDGVSPVEARREITDYSLKTVSIDLPKFDPKKFKGLRIAPADLVSLEGLFLQPEQPKKLELV